jgi:hypothetical protein
MGGRVAPQEAGPQQELCTAAARRWSSGDHCAGAWRRAGAAWARAGRPWRAPRACMFGDSRTPLKARRAKTVWPALRSVRGRLCLRPGAAVPAPLPRSGLATRAPSPPPTHPPSLIATQPGPGPCRA